MENMLLIKLIYAFHFSFHFYSISKSHRDVLSGFIHEVSSK